MLHQDYNQVKFSFKGENFIIIFFYGKKLIFFIFILQYLKYYMALMLEY